MPERYFAARKRASRERELAVSGEVWDASPEVQEQSRQSVHDAGAAPPVDDDEANWPAACIRGMP